MADSPKWHPSEITPCCEKDSSATRTVQRNAKAVEPFSTKTLKHFKTLLLHRTPPLPQNGSCMIKSFSKLTKSAVQDGKDDVYLYIYIYDIFRILQVPTCLS